MNGHLGLPAGPFPFAVADKRVSFCSHCPGKHCLRAHLPTEVLGNSRETGPSREGRKSCSPREGISGGCAFLREHFPAEGGLPCQRFCLVLMSFAWDAFLGGRGRQEVRSQPTVPQAPNTQKASPPWPWMRDPAPRSIPGCRERIQFRRSVQSLPPGASAANRLLSPGLLRSISSLRLLQAASSITDFTSPCCLTLGKSPGALYTNLPNTPQPAASLVFARHRGVWIRAQHYSSARSH